MILGGDCLEVLKTLPDNYIQTCITSPPYWGLRDYGHAGQLGQETTIEQYVARIVEVFREVRRVLKDDGTLWLNLGDSYAGSPGSPVSGLKAKDLVGVPWRIAFALRADGWFLRQDIVWAKSNPMPESVVDRCTKAHEYIFLMSKSPRYYFDHEAIKEPAICGAKGSQFHTGKAGLHQLGRAQKVRPSKKKGEFQAKGEPLPGQLPFRAIRDMRNKRSVWHVSTKPYKGAHFATFPPDLIEPCVLAGAAPGEIVLDPFFGAGTTGLVALKNNRRYVGIEINPEYIALAEKRLNEATADQQLKLGAM